MAGYIQKRSGGGYALKLRVPTALVPIVGRTHMRDGLKTRDRLEATKRAADLVTQYRTAWAALLDGDKQDARKQFEAAKAITARFGLPYRVNISDAPIEERLRRADAFTKAETIEERVALAGGILPATFKVSDLLPEIEKTIATKLADKSEPQLRRWRLARDRAIRNFISVSDSDLELQGITRNHALDFQSWWQDRILNEGLKPGSANKDLQHLSTMFKKVTERHRIEDGNGHILQNPFTGLNLEERRRESPHAITREEIAYLLNRVDEVNDESAALFILCAQTGLRPSEACNLISDEIILDHKIPHLSLGFRKDRERKSDNAVRKIPLVGSALEAMKNNASGFPRYKEKEPAWCAAISKWMRAKLPETERLSAYSLRHGFEDRMLAAKIDERERRDLMGHALKDRERYGAGASLERLAEIMREAHVGSQA